MESNERIRAIVNELFAGNVAQFAIELGKEKPTVYKWLEKPVGYGVLKQVLEHFPQINREWLINGRGDMFSQPPQDIVEKLLEENSKLLEQVRDLTGIIQRLVKGKE